MALRKVPKAVDGDTEDSDLISVYKEVPLVSSVLYTRILLKEGADCELDVVSLNSNSLEVKLVFKNPEGDVSVPVLMPDCADLANIPTYFGVSIHNLEELIYLWGLPDARLRILACGLAKRARVRVQCVRNEDDEFNIVEVILSIGTYTSITQMPLDNFRDLLR